MIMHMSIKCIGGHAWMQTASAGSGPKREEQPTGLQVECSEPIQMEEGQWEGRAGHIQCTGHLTQVCTFTTADSRCMGNTVGMLHAGG